ncbi:MAG: hypothetical protein QME44_06430 [Thermodesulfobacteriota bacterium]|nr:hypothetical protein [Thermodesulfobacteriota bacterium]
MNIDLNNAESGMVIAEDTLNSRGSLILKKGTVLTDDLIKKLKSWGVSELCVEGDGQENTPAISKGIGMEELEGRFSDVRGNAIMEKIMAAVREYVAGKGSAHGAD